MLKHFLSSKIHRAIVTDANVDYEGSMAIDEEFLEAAGIAPFEKILIGNHANGHRFETYAIPAPAGTREVCLNGATAHLGKPGDLLVIMSFTQVEESAASTWKPRTATLAEGNRRIVRLENPEVPTSLLTTFQR